MKNLLRYAIILAILPVIYLSSCKEEKPEATNVYQTLKAYMITDSLDLPKMLTSWVVDPKSTNMGGFVDSLTGTATKYHVFDFRSATDFAAGHIPGAINVVLKDVLTTAANYTDKPILCVCYTGQTAGQACMALRLSGYKNAVVLKWGMAGWNPQFKTPWISNSGFEVADNGNKAVGHANWVTTTTASPSPFADPSILSTKTTGAEIMAERVQAILDGGFAPADGTAVLAAPADYAIYNYWSEADYTGMGHFAGAFDVPTIALANVTVFDPARECLVYCYTGQTSSMVTFWMNVLGYNTKSIGFGANRMIYPVLKANKKSAYPGPKNWPFVTGA